MSQRSYAKPRSTWSSVLLLVTLLLAWCGVLTLVFMVVFDNFLFRVTHPHASGWFRGPWGFLLLYAMLCLPVFPFYNRLESRLEEQRRNTVRKGG